MITSIYEEVGEIKEQAELEAALRRIGYYEMFEPIVWKFPENWVPFVRYVLHGYSVKSDYTTLGENWAATKRKIADFVGIPKDEQIELPGILLPIVMYVFDALMELKIECVNQVINEYMNFQDDREFSHLMALRETYQLFLRSPYRNIDDDQKYKNIMNAAKIWEELKNMESTIEQRWMEVGLRDAKKEVEKAVGVKKRTLSLEQRINTQ